ncbi:MAG: IS4 family transposase [Deltaproteobacteria bacterium]|nr:IS4 family transposase [Deltaproteobacteria bacterium]
MYMYVNNTLELPDTPPTLREATRMLASLGGFLGRKGDGEPGTTTLWRGIQCLKYIAATYLLLLPRLRAGP